MLWSNVKYISFASGAHKGVILEGWLQACEDHYADFEKFKSQIVGVAGSSIGAYVALMFALNLPREARMELERDMFNIRSMLHPDVTLIASRYGFDDGFILREFTQRVLTRGGLSPSSTLGDLKRLLRMEFAAITSSMNTLDTIVLSSTTRPNMSVCDALYASCAIPLVFTPAFIDEHMCVDGNMTCGLGNVFSEHETLFLNLSGGQETETPRDWPDFIRKTLSFSTKMQERYYLNELERRNPERFWTFTSEVNVIETNPDHYEEYLNNGYNVTYNKLLNNKLLENICEIIVIYVGIMSLHTVSVSPEEEAP